MSNNIPDKIDYLNITKDLIKDKLDSTGQDTNVPLSKYSDLIRNIPNTGAISYNQIDDLTNLTIKINKKKA